MPSTAIKDKLIIEINLLPENALAEVYNYIHYFRLGSEKKKIKEEVDLMSFSGAWKDMDNEIFDDFLSDISERRSKAFCLRRSNEAITD